MSNDQPKSNNQGERQQSLHPTLTSEEYYLMTKLEQWILEAREVKKAAQDAESADQE